MTNEITDDEALVIARALDAASHQTTPTEAGGCLRCRQTPEQRQRDHKTRHADDCPNRGRRVAVQQLRTGGLPALPEGTGRESAKRITQQVRSGLMTVFEQMGGERALLEWAIENPSSFFAMWSKAVPRESESANRASGITVVIPTVAEMRRARAAQVIDVTPEPAP